MRLGLVLSGDLQFRGPCCSLFPPFPLSLLKVCCPPYSKANVRDSITPYFSLFYSRTSAGTGGLCKAKRVEEERGLWPMGWTGIVPSSPLGNGFILFYVGRMEVVTTGVRLATTYY